MLTAAATITILMFVVWLISVVIRDASIVDIVWGAGFVAVAWSLALQQDKISGYQWLIVAMVTIWGTRLTLYLGQRNLGNGEDFRYQAMRRKWGSRFAVVSLVTVFFTQGFVMWVVALPIQSAFSTVPISAQPLVVVSGFVIWLIGLMFEVIGDWQLSKFKADANNEGKVLDTGLWRWTRHPNYFGDFLVWWGVFLVAVGQDAKYWTVLGPIVMSIFLRYISGARLLEQTLKRRKPEYRQYIENTNAFFPGFPRNR